MRIIQHDTRFRRYIINIKKETVMKNVDSKLLLGLVVGAAVGAAVGYLAATDKREDLLNSVVGKVKEGFNSALAKYKEGKAEAVKPVEEVIAE